MAHKPKGRHWIAPSRNLPMNKSSSQTETNSQAAQRLLLSRGLQEVSGFTFELPSGRKVKVVSEDDPFLSKPYKAGTAIIPFTSAKAGALVKVGGDCWLLYQNDPDPWPSDFHAHNYERNETLDCYSGNIYDSTTRKLVRKYRPKKLAAFLEDVPKSWFQSRNKN